MKNFLHGNELYAHSPNEKGQWHRLDDHLTEVAGLAKGFAEKFECREWGRVAEVTNDR